ncbi:helix-turn-helix transcriptional regulator [Acidiferrobacter sp.]|uniref:helix-turn-helix domain-containing protein n=1 Tax=Acidiferrobacter sp. TaxID=1872107 RepID=UPI0026254708|nr:helix-turn-helix transcriptional regulator [Acidiferrobacter sp.]
MTEIKEREGAPGSAAPTQANSLGAFIKKARQDVSMSLRNVEEATNKEVSNGYLSQLESGKISKPSPHILYTLSTVLTVDYETLMQRAGYILPNAPRTERATHGRAATFAIDSLTADEETQLLEYLTFLRSKKKK